MFQKIARAVAKRWGPTSAKQAVWDSEYRRGAWTYNRHGKNDEWAEPLYPILEPLTEGARILDLGCGSGMTVLEMAGNFEAYLGVDISPVAVATARDALSGETEKGPKASFLVADIASFEPPGVFSVLIFRESIYYVPLHQIEPMLRRCIAHLSPAGSIVIRICDREKHRRIIAIARNLLQVTEVFAARDSLMSIYVCNRLPGANA